MTDEYTDDRTRAVTFAIIAGDKIALEIPLSNWSSPEKIERTIDLIRGGIQMAVVDQAREERRERHASLSEARGDAVVIHTEPYLS